MASYGNSNVMLVRHESSTDMSIVAMLATCSPVAALQVQHRGGGGLEDAIANCGQKRAYYPVFEASAGEDPMAEELDMGDDCTQQVEKKRRLSFDQVRSLEKNFEIENKLEPERKMQLAKELGLQPRQVAVWFQNRRARWKIKQLERDYEVLSSDFNRLKSDYDAVLLEKEELEGQRAYLTQKMHTVQQPQQAAEELLLPEKLITTAPPPETCEGETVKTLQVMRDGVGNVSKPSSAKETSSGSISSELLNADSPRTSTNSCVLVPLPVNYGSAEMVDSSSIIDHVLGDQLLSQLHGCHRMSVKPENGSFQDESCNYMLAQLDEDRGLPWWDWP